MTPPEPNTFDPANARELCAASADAYATTIAADLAGESSTNAGQTEVWSDATDTRVVITRRDDDLLVAFRGTADLRNWLTDLDCELTHVGQGRVHRGFHEAVKAVEVGLSATLGEEPGARLWVTGHSLGGALAMLWALWAVQSGHEIAGVYTFGQPRAGDAAFSQIYNSKLKTRTWRSVHADDLVPRVPWMLGRFRHAGHEVFYPSSAPWWPAVDRPFWTRLPGEARGLACELRQGKLALLEDHHVLHYLALFPEPRTEVHLSHA